MPYNKFAVFSGVWLSLVEHLVRDQEAGGSNPLTPTITEKRLSDNEGRLFYTQKRARQFATSQKMFFYFSF